jgi:hypothetical protein
MTRKVALFAGSDGGARHWAIAMTLIQTAKLNGVEPMAVALPQRKRYRAKPIASPKMLPVSAHPAMMP